MTADNYVYILDGKAYVNITNKCHNACSFCIRKTGNGVAGTRLWLEKEPTADEVLTAFSRLDPVYDEVVFCGFGEPTENLETLKECARAFKQSGYRTRLNTNGLGNLVNFRNIAPELTDIDTVSVSLNAPDARKYADITKSVYGLKAFEGLLEFVRDCKATGLNVVFTVVDVIDHADLDECRKLSIELGIPLRVRKYIADNYDSGKGSVL